MKNIGLGTAAIGRPQYINIKQESREEFDRVIFEEKGRHILDAAYQQGVRYFDTAPGYGLAEQLLINWVKEKRDITIEVASKWGYAYVANFDPNATVHEIKDHTINQLTLQWEKTKELQPYLTTLQVHSATFETGVLNDKEVLNKLAEMKSQYNMLIGLTTTGDNQVDVIKYAMDVCVDGVALFDAYQVTYNILDQSLSEVSNLLTAAGKRMIIKEALANGRVFKNDKYPYYNSLYHSLAEMSKKYRVGVDAIALRFCMQSIEPFMVLSGASESIQLTENLKSNDFMLEVEDLVVLKSFKIDPKTYWAERKLLQWN
ncbi:MAG: aryl-alcohol dehydrogenase-like predicted oxidoreductase [Cyclobacteriaceae bacterium]